VASPRLFLLLGGAQVAQDWPTFGTVVCSRCTEAPSNLSKLLNPLLLVEVARRMLNPKEEAL
jgi:hypothetical protein